MGNDESYLNDVARIKEEDANRSLFYDTHNRYMTAVEENNTELVDKLKIEIFEIISDRVNIISDQLKHLTMTDNYT